MALPLDEINAACKADKDRKTGTIRNLHKWFAPARLPAWRALLFATLVDDPGDEEKRAYLLDVIKRLVANGADLPDDDTLNEARKIIAKQFPDGVPTATTRSVAADLPSSKPNASACPRSEPTPTPYLS